MKHLTPILLLITLLGCSTVNVFNANEGNTKILVGFETPGHPECDQYYITLYNYYDDALEDPSFTGYLDSMRFQENVYEFGVIVYVFGYADSSDQIFDYFSCDTLHGPLMGLHVTGDRYTLSAMGPRSRGWPDSLPVPRRPRRREDHSESHSMCP